MSDGKDARFSRLERKRIERAKSEETEKLSSEARFASMELDTAVRSESIPAPSLERFEAPPQPELAIATSSPGDQPFVRCMRCEVDNSLHVDVCRGCGEDLATDAQRIFNKALWERRVAEQAAEREAVERIESARIEDERRARALETEGRILVAEIEARRRARRDDPLNGSDDLGPILEQDWRPLGRDDARARPTTSLARAWLSRIENPILRASIIALALSVPLALATAGSAALQTAGIVGVVVVILLFMPSRTLGELRVVRRRFRDGPPGRNGWTLRATGALAVVMLVLLVTVLLLLARSGRPWAR